jgi:hypothetical protein
VWAFAFSSEESLYTVGVEAITAGTARALALAYDCSRHRRVLDLGGSTACFPYAILGQHSALEGALYDAPAEAMTDEVLMLVRHHKPGLLALLQQVPASATSSGEPEAPPAHSTALTPLAVGWRCPWCHGTRRWRSIYNVLICATCHPPGGHGAGGSVGRRGMITRLPMCHDVTESGSDAGAGRGRQLAPGRG